MKKLYIISGHGAGDNGACKNGFKEAERVRALAQKIKDFGGDNVLLHDPSLNAYKNNSIGKGLIPKDCKVLELHLDSSLSKSAKGGHIIIHKKYDPDKYDDALAKMISSIFPGRSKIIDGRSDLANANRAVAKGLNYRLMECCFISNVADIEKFNANLDKLAKEILECFDIAIVKTQKDEPTKISKYYKQYTGKSSSLVDALKSIGVANTFANRKKIANKNGIKLYTGTAKQNTQLLNLLKQGKLIKP